MQQLYARFETEHTPRILYNDWYDLYIYTSIQYRYAAERVSVSRATLWMTNSLCYTIYIHTREQIYICMCVFFFQRVKPRPDPRGIRFPPLIVNETMRNDDIWITVYVWEKKLEHPNHRGVARWNWMLERINKKKKIEKKNRGIWVFDTSRANICSMGREEQK